MSRARETHRALSAASIGGAAGVAVIKLLQMAAVATESSVPGSAVVRREVPASDRQGVDRRGALRQARRQNVRLSHAVAAHLFILLFLPNRA